MQIHAEWLSEQLVVLLAQKQATVEQVAALDSQKQAAVEQVIALAGACQIVEQLLCRLEAPDDSGPPAGAAEDGIPPDMAEWLRHRRDMLSELNGEAKG